ncbi:MAG: M20/M25/M40 family metallo-hydrolase [bacterium]|nr:M20/M25/M40 family metallo-hydrolase [bacterium]
MVRIGGRVSVGLMILVIPAGCHQPGSSSNFIDRQIIGEVLMHSEFSANLRELCVPGGRLSGSPNGHQAERYVADRLVAYGLESVHLEPFEMVTWRDRETKVTVLGQPPHVVEGALSLGNCLSTPEEGITAELLDAGQGSAEELAAVGETLRGKFALVREGGLHRGEKMALAVEYGVAGLLQVSKLEDRARVGQCHPEPRPQPGIAIPGAEGARLAERLASGEQIRINVRVLADAWEAEPNNVVGEIPGSGRLAEEVVILAAHLDSWHLAEGALDNGSGAATILEAARALAAVDWQPRRTVRLIWFMGEEHGLHGSRAYVRAHGDELDNIVAVVNVDMPGSPRRLSTFGHEEVMDFLRAVNADLRGFEISDEIGNASWTASDHAPFMKEGVCAISLGGDCGPGVKYYHSHGDTYEQVDRRGTVQSAAALAMLVRRLADIPQRPTERLDPVALAEKMGWDRD